MIYVESSEKRIKSLRKHIIKMALMGVVTLICYLILCGITVNKLPDYSEEYGSLESEYLTYANMLLEGTLKNAPKDATVSVDEFGNITVKDNSEKANLQLNSDGSYTWETSSNSSHVWITLLFTLALVIMEYRIIDDIRVNLHEVKIERCNLEIYKEEAKKNE